MYGIIKRLTDKGIGFIEPLSGGKAAFFHASELQGIEINNLREGDFVTFDLVISTKGINALSIRKGVLVDLEDQKVPFKDDVANFGEYSIKWENGHWVLSINLPDGTGELPDGTMFVGNQQIQFRRNKWTILLRQLEELINNPKVKEIEFQRFFEENPAFLSGDDYDSPIPQATIVASDDTIWNADFVLIPKDQIRFARILELKLPQEKISLIARSKHENFSSKLYRAINQLKDYHQAFTSEKTRIKFQQFYNVEIFRPDLQLLFGRRNSISNTRQFQEFQRRMNVEIKDWDSFLEESKRRFK